MIQQSQNDSAALAPEGCRRATAERVDRMDKTGKDSQLPTAIMVVANDAGRPAAGKPSFNSLVAIDLAAEAASLDAGRVSQTLATTETLSLTNLQPGALPKLLQRP